MFVSFRKCSPPQKPDPISDRNCQNLYSFSDQNSSKTIPFGAAHTYIPYIGEYPPPPPGYMNNVWTVEPSPIIRDHAITVENHGQWSDHTVITGVITPITPCWRRDHGERSDHAVITKYLTGACGSFHGRNSGSIRYSSGSDGMEGIVNLNGGRSDI